MQQFLWRIEASGVPNIQRRCPRCEHKVFESSGLFRLNSQQKHIDVWLVYKCKECAYTYNLPIYTRVSPRELERRGIYERLLANDERLARQYASDMALLRRNHAQPLPVQDGYEILGPVPEAGKNCLLQISLPNGMHLRADALLARKLGLPRSRVQRCIKNGTLGGPDGTMCPKILKGTLQLRLPAELWQAPGGPAAGTLLGLLIVPTNCTEVG